MTSSDWAWLKEIEKEESFEVNPYLAAGLVNYHLSPVQFKSLLTAIKEMKAALEEIGTGIGDEHTAKETLARLEKGGF